MYTEKINFENQNGSQLKGILRRPFSQKIKAFVLFAHCFTCTKNLTAIKHLSNALTDKGFAVLSFDFTGLGESEGDFADTNFSSNIADLLEAANYLEREFEAPSVLIGHSLGGAAVLFATEHIPSVKAVATIGAPFNPAHIQHLFEDEIDQISKDGSAKVNIGGRPFNIKKQFLEDVNKRRTNHILDNLRKPLLILHSPQDETVRIDNAAQLYQKAHHPKSFISLDKADHLLSDPKDSGYSGQVIASWVERYLDIEDSSKLNHDVDVAAQTISSKPPATELQIGQKHLTIHKGEPSPTDLLLSGLASCSAMTVKAFVQKEKWKIGDVEVLVQHQTVETADLDEESKKAYQDFDTVLKVQLKIKVATSLDKKQEAKLIEVAKNCPVSHHLSNGNIIINTSIFKQ